VGGVGAAGVAAADDDAGDNDAGEAAGTALGAAVDGLAVEAAGGVAGGAAAAGAAAGEAPAIAGVAAGAVAPAVAWAGVAWTGAAGTGDAVGAAWDTVGDADGTAGAPIDGKRNGTPVTQIVMIDPSPNANRLAVMIRIAGRMRRNRPGQGKRHTAAGKSYRHRSALAVLRWKGDAAPWVRCEQPPCLPSLRK
jgi:hypothetical protein